MTRFRVSRRNFLRAIVAVALFAIVASGIAVWTNRDLIWPPEIGKLEESKTPSSTPTSTTDLISFLGQTPEIKVRQVIGLDTDTPRGYVIAIRNFAPLSNVKKIINADDRIAQAVLHEDNLFRLQTALLKKYGRENIRLLWSSRHGLKGLDSEFPYRKTTEKKLLELLPKLRAGNLSDAKELRRLIPNFQSRIDAYLGFDQAQSYLSGINRFVFYAASSGEDVSGFIKVNDFWLDDKAIEDQVERETGKIYCIPVKEYMYDNIKYDPYKPVCADLAKKGFVVLIVDDLQLVALLN